MECRGNAPFREMGKGGWGGRGVQSPLSANELKQLLQLSKIKQQTPFHSEKFWNIHVHFPVLGEINFGSIWYRVNRHHDLRIVPFRTQNTEISIYFLFYDFLYKHGCTFSHGHRTLEWRCNTALKSNCK